MSFINVYQDNRGLWTASLCSGRREIENLGGSYPKSRSARLDGELKWGRGLVVKLSYRPMFISDEVRLRIMRLIDNGVGTEDISNTLGIKVTTIRAIKAHLTMGNYSR